MIKNLKEMDEQENTARQRARGMSAELEQTEKTFQNLIQQVIFAAGRQATGEEGLGSSALMLRLQDFLQGAFGSENARTVARVGGGAVGGGMLEPFGNLAMDKPMELSDMGFFLGLLMGNMPGKMGTFARTAAIPQIAGGGIKGASNELFRTTGGELRFEKVVEAINNPTKLADETLQKLANIIKGKPINQDVVVPSAQQNNQSDNSYANEFVGVNSRSPNNQTIGIGDVMTAGSFLK